MQLLRTSYWEEGENGKGNTDLGRAMLSASSFPVPHWFSLLAQGQKPHGHNSASSWESCTLERTNEFMFTYRFASEEQRDNKWLLEGKTQRNKVEKKNNYQTDYLRLAFAEYAVRPNSPTWTQPTPPEAFSGSACASMGQRCRHRSWKRRTKKSKLQK